MRDRRTFLKRSIALACTVPLARTGLANIAAGTYPLTLVDLAALDSSQTDGIPAHVLRIERGEMLSVEHLALLRGQDCLVLLSAANAVLLQELTRFDRSVCLSETGMATNSGKRHNAATNAAGRLFVVRYSA